MTHEEQRDAMSGTPEVPTRTEERRAPHVGQAPAPAGLAQSSAEHRAYVQRQQAQMEPDGWPEEGAVLATYHGPSGSFVAGDVTFEAGGDPVEVDVQVLRGLRLHFPDHTWQVLGTPEELRRAERKAKREGSAERKG